LLFLVLGVGQVDFCTGSGGTLAERMLVDWYRLVKLPSCLSAAVAAALLNVIIGADIALRGRTSFLPGETVFINGTTDALPQV
jgi:NADPH:quinone reductase-like Zn-dependent oxidoreductase